MGIEETENMGIEDTAMPLDYPKMSRELRIRQCRFPTPKCRGNWGYGNALGLPQNVDRPIGSNNRQHANWGHDNTPIEDKAIEGIEDTALPCPYRKIIDRTRW